VILVGSGESAPPGGAPAAHCGQTKWPRKKAIAKTTRRICDSMKRTTPIQKPRPIFSSRLRSFIRAKPYREAADAGVRTRSSSKVSAAIRGGFTSNLFRILE
jgi:hypothetical protein